MTGSHIAAERANGAAGAPGGDRLRRFFVMAGLIASVGLAACSTPAPPAVVPPPPATAAPPALPEPAPAAPAAARIPELPVLTGLGPAELVALFGEPDFHRRAPGGTLAIQ